MGPVKVWAPGKLILLGEHAAVYGYPAAGIALDQGISIEAGPQEQESRFPGIPIEYIPLLKKLIYSIKGSESEMTLHIKSDIPIGGGLGSSGALCVALARFFHPEMDNQSLWYQAHQAEKLVHGTPSGIDTGLSVYGAMQAFIPGKTGLPSRIALPGLSGWLLLSAVPRMGTTLSLVAGLRDRMLSGDSVLHYEMESLGQYSRELIECPGTVTSKRLGELCQSAHHILRSWGLSLSILDDYLLATREWGSLGGKVSGAGGGGAFFSLYADQDLALQAATLSRKWFRDRGQYLLMAPRVISLS